jgi:hypothetical protein
LMTRSSGMSMLLYSQMSSDHSTTSVITRLCLYRRYYQRLLTGPAWAPADKTPESGDAGLCARLSGQDRSDSS